MCEVLKWISWKRLNKNPVGFGRETGNTGMCEVINGMGKMNWKLLSLVTMSD